MVCLRLGCGVFCCGSGGGSSLERGVGMMYELDLVKVNRSMVKSVRLIVAVGRMVPKDDELRVMIKDLEREMREAAAECQRVLALVEAEGKRPLISG